jgi:hypothetical protein
VENCFFDLASLGTEIGEELHLNSFVLAPLEEAGLIGDVVIGSKYCHGEPDFSIWGGHSSRTSLKIVGESKSTHNMPLPMKAQEVGRQYNDARADVDQLSEESSDRQRRPLGWSHVGHPVSTNSWILDSQSVSLRCCDEWIKNLLHSYSA